MQDYAKHNYIKDIEVDGAVNKIPKFTVTFGWTMFILGLITLLIVL